MNKRQNKSSGIFAAFREVELLDLSIEPLGLKLRGGVDLATRRP